VRKAPGNSFPELSVWLKSGFMVPSCQSTSGIVVSPVSVGEHKKSTITLPGVYTMPANEQTASSAYITHTPISSCALLCHCCCYVCYAIIGRTCFLLELRLSVFFGMAWGFRALSSKTQGHHLI